MIIENPDAFKTWLTSILEPLCDADPAALAKYVYALVKKDKSMDELREGMLDQLDVFLQQETKSFVEMLFRALDSQEYLKGAEAKLPSPPSPIKEEASEVEQNGNQEAPVMNGKLEEAPLPPAAPQRLVLNRSERSHRVPPHGEQTLVKVLPLTELLEEPVDQLPRRRERRADSSRDKDERRRRRSRSWEHRRPRRGPHDNHDRRHDKRIRPSSRSPSPRRYRNRSPPPTSTVDRPPSRSRSRSPIPIRDRLHERVRPLREMERDRLSRDRDHRERLSHSRDRERSRDRSRSRSPGSPSRDERVPLSAFKRRCRDFDEKGYCMRGDLCQWDHGTDPLVLEDVLNMPRVPEYNPLAPNIWGGGAVPPPFIPPPRDLVHIPRIAAPAIPPPMPRHPPPKKNFDFNRLGAPRPSLGPNSANCSLEVKKVPPGLNDITHLNNHFSKFGKIVNIQVCFDNDPEAALITFSNHTEANIAYKSTEAVLNNRFIKVFWHNPETKPESANIGAAQKPNNNTYNKVLINKGNMKQTAVNKIISDQEKAAANTKETNSTQLASKDQVERPTSELIKEQHKKAQSLLKTQLHQQTLRIQQLESGNISGPQKTALLEAINSAQEGIEKLRKELVAYNKMRMQMQANAKRPKTREEAQKEILDTELDIFTKQQEGQDVTELLKRVGELRRQMALQFPTHPSSRRGHGRGGRFTSSVRFPRPTAKVFVNQSVDHRPRALLVSGFESDDMDGLLKHFTQFGPVTTKDIDVSVPQLVIQFSSRAAAELAVARGKHYNDRTLAMTWVTGSQSQGSSGSAQNGANVVHENGDTEQGQENTAPAASEEQMLRFDEEEEDDAEEDRSWRR